jgi:hypothetical protein
MKSQASTLTEALDVEAGEPPRASSLPARLGDCTRFLRGHITRLRTEAGKQSERDSAAAWLLDNQTYLQTQVRETRRELSARSIRKLPRSKEHPFEGEYRVYQIAELLVESVGGHVVAEAFSGFSDKLREEQDLKLAELWALPAFLRLALLERLCRALRAGAADELTIARSVEGLRAIESVPWRDFVESASVVEAVLRRDPACVYQRMDFLSRNRYREVVEETARLSKLSEVEVAELARRLAEEAAASGETDERKRHDGYYLAGRGIRQLRRQARCRLSVHSTVRSLIEACPNLFYLGSIGVLTTLIMLGFLRLVGSHEIGVALLLALPASQAALEIVNIAVSRFFRPRTLPALDFAGGIPDDCRTMVVVPTLLLSKSGAEKLLEDLEIRYLANRDANLSFGLLTDFPDSRENVPPNGGIALEVCSEGLRRLNQRYGSQDSGPFYLFHRGYRWNEREHIWMGYERKRGKLNEFNELLLGRENLFETILGDQSVFPTIRYIITLDTDTQLPRDSARGLVGTLAHPLNRAILNERTRTVREGYTILQPRVAISMQSSGKSRLAQIFSGETGFDPYTTAVSDVYQDLYGQASFTGKGIYDLRMFETAVGSRFPENTILSHDLIEGEHARVGLVTNIEVIDDYPATYQAFSKRKHRWVRGDWQILPWLFGRVPGPDGKNEPNPLPLLSRWKIFDNLRRSLVEPSLFLLLIAGWFLAPEQSGLWVAAVLALLLLPCYARAILTLLSPPERRFWNSFVRNVGSHFWSGHREAAINLVFLPHQACLMIDAIVRTLVRQHVTHRKMLEWETMAQAESIAGAQISMVDRYLYIAAGFGLVLFTAFNASELNFNLFSLLCAAWTVSPLVVFWLNAPPRKPAGLKAGDHVFLRSIALRTWRYFADNSTAETNWLVPDNVQEDPPLTAHQISPTNLGVLLTSNLCAKDFGYLTLDEASQNLERVFESMARMPRQRGHFLNWYNTQTLDPLKPRYISAVDSGNLAASLCVVQQGCLDLLRAPVLNLDLIAGIRDHAVRLRDEVPYGYRSIRPMRLFAGLLRLLEFQPSDLLAWKGLLTEVQESCEHIGAEIDGLCGSLRKRGSSGKAEELEYWLARLRERVTSAIAELNALAPWMTAQIEPELRVNAGEASFSDLYKEISLVPTLAKAPEHYDRIDTLVQERLNGPVATYPGLRRALEQLQVSLASAKAWAIGLTARLGSIATLAGWYFEEMDFRFLFDSSRMLLYIGYHPDSEKMDNYHYDLLASEARTAVFLAIAKGDIPREAWVRLGRKLTNYRNHRSLLSWSGTMFEYLMPCLYLRSYEGTLLDRSVREAVKIQQVHGRAHRIPWGISEAAYAVRDSRMQYQYRAFGVPALSSRPDLATDLVVAPYATLLALPFDPAAATQNLWSMAANGWLTRHGFFESVDYTPRGGETTWPSVVRTHMAHHQGMSLAAIHTALLGGRMQELFHLDPAVQATEYLLQERMPAMLESAEAEDNAPAAA